MMRAAVLYDVDDVRVEERPVPSLPEGGLIVRSVASGICSGDLMPWYIRKKAPLVLGHEPAGVIAECAPDLFDDDQHPVRPGDRVFVHHHAPCFACACCARGDYVQCALWRASRIEPGGIAEFFAVPSSNVRDTLRVPDGVSMYDATLIEPLACVVKSLRRSRIGPGGRMYVIGLGVMGLMHVLLGVESGVRVAASDFSASRRELAAELGAEIVVDAAGDARGAIREHFKGEGPDVAICGPGNEQALTHAIETVRDGGTVLLFTPLEPGVPFPLDQSDVYFRDLTIVASYSCGPNDTRAALDHINRARVTGHKLRVHRYPLADVAAAYAAMRSGEIVKAVIKFQGG